MEDDQPKITDEENELISQFLKRTFELAKRTSDICPHCGQQVTSMEQVGRSVYLSCGCRLYQGSVPEAWKAEE